MHFDLVIIGGGINGVAIAREAAQKGYRVVIVEKATLGSGTSSKTSKLAHGGLRYLEQFQFKVVYESLNERDRLLKDYPDLVKPMPFVVPLYKWSPWSRWKLSLGLHLYDWMGRAHRMPRHERLSREDMMRACPSLIPEGLLGGFRYYDAQMDDLGLLHRIAEECRALGVIIIENTSVKAILYQEGHAVGVACDSIRHSRIMGRQILQCAGPWSGALLNFDEAKNNVTLIPSKGVHIVLPDHGYKDALLLSAPQDGRVFFVIPWKGHCLVGTTETLYRGEPDDVSVSDEDRRYLLEAYNYYFKQRFCGLSDIVSEFVGLRPLVTHTDKSHNPGAISRDFFLYHSKTGFYTLLGGKYTTHHAVAARVCEALGL